MRRLPLLAVLVSACAVPVGGGAPTPPPATVASQEPSGFLLELRDSLQLNEDQRIELVRIGSRLFSRNRPLRFAMDTILRRAGHEPTQPLRAGQEYPPALRARLDSIGALIRANNLAMKDTAWAILTPPQQARADSMLGRYLERMNRPPAPGPTPGQQRP